ncbi:oxidoreductase [Angomonas deanei]|uniref:2OG-Fe(II) oxygenase superfamily n=1 Tax=Angomonas deanei TaxID=59799 RepID=A0A7G2C819_9TRYP|nr:oxidoreductase [Angomonas deanei]CAD2215886.1 hypothetical protein, conserved [Angomonas deanei]|eukprot:EPY36756.1 oxidoreductase [Angomonas deanei]
MPVEREAVTFTVTLLPVAQEKNSGTSNQGCPYLAMVPCNTRYVMEHTQVPFQKDVIGQDLFFSSNETISSGVSGPGPRTIVSEPIREVPGLYWVADFVTQEEHDRILSHFRGSIDNGTLTPEQLARRTVLHFNRRFIYGVNQLGAVGEDVNENPPFYTWMRDRLQNTDAGVEIVGEYPFEKGTFTCDQLTVNLYDYSKSRVSGIAPHVDAHAPFEDCILIVSLGSGTVMDFSHENDAQSRRPHRMGCTWRRAHSSSLVARRGTIGCTVLRRRKTDILSEFVPKLERGYRVSLTWRKGRTTAQQKEYVSLSIAL